MNFPPKNNHGQEQTAHQTLYAQNPSGEDRLCLMTDNGTDIYVIFRMRTAADW